MASFVYNSAKGKFVDGSIDWDNDTIKVALCTSSHTPSQDDHDFFDDVDNEVSGTGYTAGGATLSNCSVTIDDTNDLAKLDADDVTWSSSTITARYAIIYKSTGTDSTSPLIACIDFAADKSSSSDDFKIQWSSDGILTLGDAA